MYSETLHAMKSIPVYVKQFVCKPIVQSIACAFLLIHNFYTNNYIRTYTLKLFLIYNSFLSHYPNIPRDISYPLYFFDNYDEFSYVHVVYKGRKLQGRGEEN